MHTTRFAPSPTGPLHVGHAFAALTAFDAARGGHFLLRIEDLDRARSRPHFEAVIRADLAWLGVRWQEPVLHQSSRSAAYRQALALLAERGLTYPCFCTRADIRAEIARAAEAPHFGAGSPSMPGAELPYPGLCRTLSAGERARRIEAGEPFAIRLDVARAQAQCPALQFVESGAGPGGEHGRIAVQPELLGDIVLARKDLPAAYHLAVVIDDAFQSVTLVTRGQDLFFATHVQRLLQALLQLPTPLYAHHRLILDEHGKKFSKRDHAVTLRSLRELGVRPAEIRRRVGLAELAV